MIALFESSSANIERRCLATEEWRSLKDLDLMALSKQLKGSRKARCPATDHPDLHSEPTLSGFGAFVLSWLARANSARELLLSHT